jgi:hypothetical protein
MVEAYVSDVVSFLPRKQRRDVARELRALLTEGIDAAEGATREESAQTVLAGFGRPSEVAARYGPPVALIDPADTRRLIVLAAGGAALIVLATAFDTLLADVRPRTIPEDPSVVIFAWWGVLAAGFALTAWLRRRRGPVAWKPHPAATDRINRFGWGAALAFWSAGTLALAAPHWVIDRLTGGRAAPAVHEVFIYDEDFLRLRGPLTLAVMIVGLVNVAALLVLGRWTSWLRTVDLAYSIALCVVLTWVVAAGPVFSRAITDQAVRPILALIVLMSLAAIGVSSRRQSVRRALAQD